MIIELPSDISLFQTQKMKAAIAFISVAVVVLAQGGKYKICNNDVVDMGM